MPTSEKLITTFAAVHASTASDKTLNNWLAGLHFWHTVNGTIWNGVDMLRELSGAVCQNALCILHNDLDLQLPFDVIIGAVDFMAFWSCCHLGELIICSRNDLNPFKHVSCSNIQTLTHNTSYTSFHIPWTKTTKKQACPHCMSPLEALSFHKCINTDTPHSAPLFSYRMSTRWQPLTRANFINCCNNIWVQNRFTNMPGHAFHIGGITELLLQGVNLDIISV
ncbi:hypothetical protein BS17DRAFT_798446 [Gyrodon lividus]|nr:hypothetical protein BS17DRAFT_798446 [Gyrodon lividus]